MSGFLSDSGINLRIVHYTTAAIMRHTHIHPQYELYFCTENIRQKSVINGVEYSYQYPCAILSTPYTVHSMSCEDPNAPTYERYVFYFGEKTWSAFDPHLFPTELLNRNAGLLFRLNEEQAKQLKKILELREPNASLAENELIFALFFQKLIRFCPEEEILQVGTGSFYIQDVLQYISEGYLSCWDVTDITRHFSVSRSKLDRDFKRFTGVTVHHFIEICRLNQAKYLLQYQPSCTIREIAERCGFAGETYFFPFFKKHTGITPAEFRSQYAQKKTTTDSIKNLTAQAEK